MSAASGAASPFARGAVAVGRLRVRVTALAVVAVVALRSGRVEFIAVLAGSLVRESKGACTRDYPQAVLEALSVGERRREPEV
jgi:hypothetical protein